jgi:RNA polymerase sigma-70 factor, ECF subfamily
VSQVDLRHRSARASIHDIPDNPQSLAELIWACSHGGDHAAWREFVARLQPVVAATAIKAVRQFNCLSPELVDDLIQETYVRILQTEALTMFRSEEPNSIYGFIQAIAISVVQDHFRAKNARKRGGDIRHVPLDAVPSGDFLSSSDIERQILIREIEEILEELAPLPRDQAIFWFHHRQGMTAKEIALLPAIGLSAKGVESVLQRLTPEVRRLVSSVKRSTLTEKGIGRPNPS